MKRGEKTLTNNDKHIIDDIKTIDNLESKLGRK
jgi:hypothetical protein